MAKRKEKESLKAKYTYSFIEDIIYIVPQKRQYSSSFRMSNFIFDLNEDKKLVGLEILNASKIMRIHKTFLARAFDGVLELRVQKDKIFIRLEMLAVFRNQRLRNIMESMEKHENHLSPSLTNFDLQPITTTPHMIGG